MPKATTKKKAASTASSPLALKRASVGGQLVLGALIGELLASAALTIVALMSGNNPIIAAVAVIVLVLVFTDLSGAHINPVVTVIAWATKQVGWVKAVGYIVAQLIGAMVAYVIVSRFMKSDPNSATSVYTLFTPPMDVNNLAQTGATPRTPGEWKPILGELTGAVVFGFGVASAMLYKKVGFDRAFTIGGALMLGLLGALAGSYAVLNPAVALGLSGYAQGGWWSIGAYALAPLVGGTLGALLFKFLKRDVDAAPAVE